MSSVFSPIVAKGRTASERASAACEAMSTGLFRGAIFIQRNVPVATIGTRATSSQRSRRLPPARGGSGRPQPEDTADDDDDRSEIVGKATARRGEPAGSAWPLWMRDGGGNGAYSINFTSAAKR